VLIAACLAEHVSCPARLSLDVANLRNSKVALALTRFGHVRRRRATAIVQECEQIRRSFQRSSWSKAGRERRRKGFSAPVFNGAVLNSRRREQRWYHLDFERSRVFLPDFYSCAWNIRLGLFRGLAQKFGEVAVAPYAKALEVL
jgi:hypothetical protein